MPSLSEIKRRSIIPVAGLALAAYYLLVFVPLAYRAHSLDERLGKGWEKLAASLDQTNALALDFQRITNRLNEVRQELASLDAAKKQAVQRLDVPAELRAKLSSPFQLVDYQIERSKLIDELDRKARQDKVAVDPVVYAGFPEHTADMADPALLWGALAMTDDLMETALRCKVSAIHWLEAALVLTNSASFDAQGRWSEIPLHLEFTASGENALRLVQSLPLRKEECAAAGLPAPVKAKAPLFIDRLIIRKETPEKLDEVRVWVRVIGFVFRE
jgi:hypothetical protein